MFLIVLYGLMIVAISLWMIVHPRSWVERATAYCRSPFMHPVDTGLSLAFGGVFVFYSSQTAFPVLIRIFGLLLLAVGTGLIVVPPSLHQRYGVWSIEKTGPHIRWLACISLVTVIFFMYAGINTL